MWEYSNAGFVPAYYNYRDLESGEIIGGLSQKDCGHQWRFWKHGILLEGHIWDDAESAKSELNHIFQNEG